MALQAAIMSRVPMVVILGATGTGKTKLGIELAQKYGGEIISADSMQIYKGLDIITAKATVEERTFALHHLIDILEPHQTFTVVDFRNRASKLIDSLMEQNRMPIIVGGTNYYIESILWRILVDDIEDTSDSLMCERSETRRKRLKLDENNELVDPGVARDSSSVSEERDAEKGDKLSGKDPKAATELTESDLKLLKESLELMVYDEEKFNNLQVYEKLKEVDPVIAERYHPNNRRKILRALEVFLVTGRRHSEILQEQKDSERKLQRPDQSIVFWLKCDQTVHDKRLDERVDSMIETGLIEELSNFHAKYNEHRIKDEQPPDYTKGVFQTLGFKHFHNYLISSEEARKSEDGIKLLNEGIDNMKMATRRYARRQNKMVKNRFLDHPTREIPLIYELDTTDVSKWNDNVKNKAIIILDSFLSNTDCEYKPLQPTSAAILKKDIDIHSRHECVVCERIFIGEGQYQEHLKSQKHKKSLRRKTRKEAEAVMEVKDPANN